MGKKESFAEAVTVDWQWAQLLQWKWTRWNLEHPPPCCLEWHDVKGENTFFCCLTLLIRNVVILQMCCTNITNITTSDLSCEPSVCLSLSLLLLIPPCLGVTLPFCSGLLHFGSLISSVCSLSSCPLPSLPLAAPLPPPRLLYPNFA